MSTLDIAVDGKEEKTAAQLDDAPFPEAGPIPTATVELEAGDEKPDAFGDADSAAPLGVEDATLDAPSGDDEIPVTPDEVAGDNERNQFVNDWHKANNTSAEELTKKTEAPAEKETPAEEEKPKRGRGRGRPSTQSAATSATEAASSASEAATSESAAASAKAAE